MELMKLVLAKTIRWAAFIIMGGLFLACLGAMGWGLIRIVPPEMWWVFGLMLLIVTAVGLLIKAWDWAENYLENYKKLDKHPN